MDYGNLLVMSAPRKITVEVPEQLLARAQAASRQGVTETVRAGLRLVAAADAYQRLSTMRGKVKLAHSWQELKDDRP
jgi:hypothetical protein